MSRRLTPPVSLVLALGTAAAASYQAVPAGDARNLTRVALDLTAALALAAGIRRRRPAYAAPWWCFTAAIGAAVAGDAIQAYYATTPGGLPFPSYADAAYLLIQPLLGAGLYLLARRMLAGRQVAVLLESLVVVGAAGLVLGAFVVAPVAHDASLTQLQQSVSITYPSMDLLLLLVAARLLLATPIRRTSLALVAAGTACALGADVWYSVATVNGSYHPGSPVESAWLLCFVLFVAAAWEPLMARAGEAQEQPYAGRAATRRRLAVLGLAAMAPVAVVLAPDADRAQNLVSMAATSAVLMMLVLARLYGTASEVTELLGERDRTRHAEELARRQTQFATMAAHELRTPLTSLRGSLTTLSRRDGAVPAELRTELVGMALRQADRLERICADLDVIVGSADGTFSVTREPVDLRAVARDVVRALGDEAVRRTAVAVDETTSAEVVADADPDRVAQVLANLVRNALQHTDGPVTVTASRSGGFVVVAVLDEGPGLDPVFADDAFQRFAPRAEGATGGLGIGLWIVHELVTAMGGTVSYDARVGGGAAFRVVLPVHAPAGRVPLGVS
jgi:signal transduction histidine kinase